MKPWSPLVLQAPKAPRKAVLGNARHLLAVLVADLGASETARILDVDRAMLTRWKKGAPISPEMSRRILGLHAVLGRAFQIMLPETALLWLVGNDPFLHFARPIDVLARRGPGPLLEALDGIDGGAFA